MNYNYQKFQELEKDWFKVIVALEWFIAGSFFDLVHENEEIISVIASTNASGWGVDTVGIRENTIKRKKGKFECVADIYLFGEQDEDKPWCGDKIHVTAIASVSPEGEVEWDVRTSELLE